MTDGKRKRKKRETEIALLKEEKGKEKGQKQRVETFFFFCYDNNCGVNISAIHKLDSSFLFCFFAGALRCAATCWCVSSTQFGSDTLLGSEVDGALRQHFQQRCSTVVTDEKQKAESKHLRGS